MSSPDITTTRTYDLTCPKGCTRHVVCAPGDSLAEWMKCNEHNEPLTVAAVNGQEVGDGDNARTE